MVCCEDDMGNIGAIVRFVLVVVLVVAISSARRIFRFEKEQSDDNEFKFSYDLSDGKTFSGKTIFLHKLYYGTDNASRFFYILLDKERMIHWVSLSQNEIDSESTLNKTVYPVNLQPNGFQFEDDYHSFRLEFYEDGNFNSLFIIPISRDWDFEHICFTRINDDRQLFQYEIKVKNTEKYSKGETFRENTNNPLVQRINLTDSWRDDYIVEIEFTKQEFNSTNTFCRGISSIIQIPTVVKEVITVENINPQALKSLVG